MASPKQLYLIDGMALIYRAHFALIKQPLLTGDGRHTSAIFGFMNMIAKLIREKKPDMLAVVLDSKEPTFRHEIYTEYKATREKMPEELSEQLEPLYEIIKATRIPIIQCPGFEADDIIGTLAKQADQEGLNTFIVSGDKDLMQLVSDNVFIFTPGTRWKPDTVYDKLTVIEKWGVPPEKIIDLLALTGDVSDNIPGIKGIGPKTANKLLNKFNSFDYLLENASDIDNPRIRDKIIQNKDIALLSKELVTLNLDVPIELHIHDLERQSMDTQLLIKLLKDLELTSIIAKLDDYEEYPNIDVKENSKKDYGIILTISDLESLYETLLEASIISFDTETTSTNPHNAEMVGMSFSTKDNTGFYIPIQYPGRDEQNTLSFKQILEKLQPIFENESIKFCGQNIKYDALVLHQYGVKLAGIKFDTMIAAHLLTPEINTLKLDTLSQIYLSYRMIPIEDLIGTGNSQITMDKVPLDDISFYAAEDADIGYQLTNKLKSIIKKEKLEIPFNSVELPLIQVLIQMEKNGVYLDLKFLSKLSKKFGDEMINIEKEIYAVSGKQFNINSPKQLGVILFDELELKKVRKRSTDINVLEVLKNHHPLPNLILDYRKYKKLTSTYIDAFPNYVNSKTNRVHTSLNQTIAATGRLSSTRPNFQNIPIRTEIGREIRKAFTAQEKGWKICSMDYSQIELRIMAHLAEESALIEAFLNGEDIHSKTAALVYKIPIQDVTPNQRRTAKIVNFGIMYGAGPYRMSQELNISMGDARGLIDTYFNTYPGIRTYIDNTISEAKQKGYVSTLMGRKRKTPNLKSNRQQIIQSEQRAAINMPIQGTAAELIKVAMIQIHGELIKKSMRSKMILQIHDELLFEVPDDELDILTNLVVNKMESAMDLSVPLKVDIGIGDNWFDAH